MKELRKFPIGSVVKWVDSFSLNEKYGLIVSYVDIKLGVGRGPKMMALNVFVDGTFKFVKPGTCKTISKPYVKIKKNVLENLCK